MQNSEFRGDKTYNAFGIIPGLTTEEENVIIRNSWLTQLAEIEHGLPKEFEDNRFLLAVALNQAYCEFIRRTCDAANAWEARSQLSE